MTRVIRGLCILAMPLTAVIAEQTEDIMLTQMQSMISDAQKRALTPSEDKALQLMVDTLKETTLPTIKKGHEDEQIIVTAAYQALVDCNSRLVKDGKSGEDYAKDSSDKHLSHETCRTGESDLAKAKAKAYEALKSFVKSLGSPPSEPSGNLGLTPWIQKSLAWFEENKKIYSEKKNASLSANGTWSSKKEECNGAEVDYESAACLWYEHSSNSITHHSRCWEEAMHVYKTVLEAGQDSVEQRKSEYTTAQKLLCYVIILNELQSSGEVPADIQQRLDHCENLQPDTDWLVLNDTTPPTKGEASFSVQLGGDTVTLPGGVIPGVTCGTEPVEGTPATTSTTTTTEAPMSTTEAPPTFTETPEPFTAPLAAKVVVEGDYETVVTDKSKFLEECSATLAPVKCVDVHPGSIVVEVDSDSGSSTAAEDLQTAVTNLRTNDLVLPSFGKLPVQSVEVDTDTTYDTDSTYDTDTVYDIE